MAPIDFCRLRLRESDAVPRRHSPEDGLSSRSRKRQDALQGYFLRSTYPMTTVRVFALEDQAQIGIAIQPIP